MGSHRPMYRVVGERRPFAEILHDNRHALGFLGILAFALVVMVAGLHHADLDVERQFALEAAQRRAAVAENQLAEIIRSGDAGVLLANIDTVSMGRAGIYIRPAGR